MGQTLSDFSVLKGLKKELERQEQTAAPKPSERYGTGATVVTVR